MQLGVQPTHSNLNLPRPPERFGFQTSPGKAVTSLSCLHPRYPVTIIGCSPHVYPQVIASNETDVYAQLLASRDMYSEHPRAALFQQAVAQLKPDWDLGQKGSLGSFSGVRFSDKKSESRLLEAAPAPESESESETIPTGVIISARRPKKRAR